MKQSAGHFSWLRLSAAILGLLAPAAHAFEKVGEDAELVFRGSGTITYNDNLFLLRQGTQSDTIEDLDGELALDVGKKSKVFHGTITAGVDYEIFDSHSDLDTPMGKAAFALNYGDDKTTVGVSGSFNQAIQPTAIERFVGPNLQAADELIKRDNYGLGGTAEHVISPKTSFDVGANYSQTDYRTAGFANLQWVQLPVDIYYNMLPKLALSGGFSYRDNWVGRSTLGKGLDSEDYFYNIGARGEFSPILTGQIRIGYTQDKIRHLGTNDTLGALANLNYTLTAKSTMNLAVNNDYGYNAYGSGFRNLGVALSDNTTLNTQWSVRGAIAYNNYAYTTLAEIDNIWALSVAATYTIGKYVTLTATYSYSEDDSSIAADSFKNNLLSLSCAVHF